MHLLLCEIAEFEIYVLELTYLHIEFIKMAYLMASPMIWLLLTGKIWSHSTWAAVSHLKKDYYHLVSLLET